MVQNATFPTNVFLRLGYYIFKLHMLNIEIKYTYVQNNVIPWNKNYGYESSATRLTS